MSSAVVKSEIGSQKVCLRRERANYRLPDIASCPYIRTLDDVIDSDGENVERDDGSTVEDEFFMVFEWMEHDLRTVPSDRFRQDSNLPKIIAKSVLSALVVLQSRYNAVHTGRSFTLSLCSLWMAK